MQSKTLGRHRMTESERISETQRLAARFGSSDGGPRMLRTSERKSFKRCPQQWWWGWVEGLRPVGLPADALWFGQGIHLALADWYIPGMKRGVDPRETFVKFVGDEMRRFKVDFVNMDDEIEQMFMDAKELGIAMLTGYLEEYGSDEHWEVLAPEQKFAVTLAKGNRKLRKLRGTFDGAIRDHADSGRIKLMEHKSWRVVDTSGLSIDDQAGSYWTVATKALRRLGLISEKEALDGIVYNILRKAMPDDRPINADGMHTNKPLKIHYVEAIVNHPQNTIGKSALAKLKVDELADMANSFGLRVLGEVSKVQPKPLFERYYVERSPYEINQQVRRIQAEALAMDRFLTGEQDIYKSPDYTCSKFCQFFQLCELDESTPDANDFKNLAFRVHDPYADHRKSASE